MKFRKFSFAVIAIAMVVIIGSLVEVHAQATPKFESTDPKNQIDMAALDKLMPKPSNWSALNPTQKRNFRVMQLQHLMTLIVPPLESGKLGGGVSEDRVRNITVEYGGGAHREILCAIFLSGDPGLTNAQAAAKTDEYFQLRKPKSRGGAGDKKASQKLLFDAARKAGRRGIGSGGSGKLATKAFVETKVNRALTASGSNAQRLVDQSEARMNQKLEALEREIGGLDVSGIGDRIYDLEEKIKEKVDRRNTDVTDELRLIKDRLEKLETAGGANVEVEALEKRIRILDRKMIRVESALEFFAKSFVDNDIDDGKHNPIMSVASATITLIKMPVAQD